MRFGDRIKCGVNKESVLTLSARDFLNLIVILKRLLKATARFFRRIRSIWVCNETWNRKAFQVVLVSD